MPGALHPVFDRLRKSLATHASGVSVSRDGASLIALRKGGFISDAPDR